jgi:ATP-dependent protease ClpP protease subunit
MGQIMSADEDRSIVYNVREYFNEPVTLDFYLLGDITEPANYIDLLSALMSATPDTRINIWIDSGGGYMTTAMAVIGLIQRTQGQVVGTIIGNAFSAASMMFLACHDREVFDGATMMVHQWSAGSDGRPDQMINQINCQVDTYKSIYKSLYRPFLTPTELKRVMSHEDLYFGSKEIIKRLRKKK